MSRADDDPAWSLLDVGGRRLSKATASVRDSSHADLIGPRVVLPTTHPAALPNANLRATRPKINAGPAPVAGSCCRVSSNVWFRECFAVSQAPKKCGRGQPRSAAQAAWHAPAHALAQRATRHIPVLQPPDAPSASPRWPHLIPSVDALHDPARKVRFSGWLCPPDAGPWHAPPCWRCRKDCRSAVPLITITIGAAASSVNKRCSDCNSQAAESLFSCTDPPH